MKKWVCKACKGIVWTITGIFVKAGEPYLFVDCATEGCVGWRHTICLSHWPQLENTGPME